MTMPATEEAPKTTKSKASTKGVTAAIEVIGPPEARYLLRLNTHNRHVRQDHVATMARDMIAGKWILNGETIKVSKDDRLLDGQHRLMAVVESHAQVPMMVIRGLDDVSQETVDIGTKRQFSDILGLSGEISSHNLSAAIRYGWYLDNFNRPKAFGVNPSLPELRKWFENNPEIRASVQVGARAGRAVIRYVPSVGTALHYLMSKSPAGRSTEFWDHLIEGDELPGSPIHALREALLRDLSQPHRMAVSHRVALTIKAYNYWVDGRTVQAIGWRKDGKAAEAYPTIGNRKEVTK